MPYRSCEVSSVVQTYHPGASEHGVESYHLQKINSKLPMESLRPWGRQLYAFLGIFYLLRVIDEMWVVLTDGSDIQPESVPNVNAGKKHWRSWWLLLALLAIAYTDPLGFQHRLQPGMCSAERSVLPEQSFEHAGDHYKRRGSVGDKRQRKS